MEAKPYKLQRPFRKLNEKLINNIVKDIGEGSTLNLTAQSNGITHRILNVWIKQGEIDINLEKESLCASLVLSLAKVRQKEVKLCRQNIRMSEKGHGGAQWTLERAYWRDFSPNVATLELAQDIEDLKNEMKKGNYHEEKRKES